MNDTKKQGYPQRLLNGLLLCSLLSLLYLSSFYNYLLFHTLAELFSITISITIFTLVWNNRRETDNHYLVFIGIASVFIAILDTFHLLAYKGMPIFIGYDTNLPTQLWIAARYLLSITVLLALALRAKKISIPVTVLVYSLVTILLLTLIFLRVFPVCYVEGTGLTNFKKLSEYIIIIILASASVWLLRIRRTFYPEFISLLLLANLVTIAGEFAFSAYFNVYGSSNLLGHLLKVIAYIVWYLAIVKAGFTHPSEVLYRQLQENEQKYRLLYTAMDQGLALHEIITDAAGKPIDYIFLDINDSYTRLFGFTREKVIGKRIRTVMPEVDQYWIDIFGKVALTGEPHYFENYLNTNGRQYATYSYSPKKNQFAVLVTDITERKEIEEKLRDSNEELILQNLALEKTKQALRESEEVYHSIITASPDDITITDLEGRILFVTPMTLKIMHCRESDIVGHLLSEFIVTEDRERAASNIALMFKGIKKGIEEYHALRGDGTVIDIEVNAEFIRDSHGQPVKIVFIARDITERNKVINKYKMLFELLPVGMAMINHKTGEFLEANKSILRSTGYTKEEFLKLTFWDITPKEYQQQEDEQFKELNETDVFVANEKEYIRKDGSRYPISISGAKLTDENGTEVVWGIIEDISERKADELKIKSLLVEKELILKEVHHRIKNNMNTIYGLLALQASSLTNTSAITALEDAGNRVKSMMLLYEKLYKSDIFTELSVLAYFPPLIEEIIANFPNRSKVKLEMRIADFVLEAKKLQPLGIIINELLTNIMKYAFVGRDDGIISISASLENNLVQLTIADNGNGIPPTVSFENTTGFGLLLVKGLTQQLNGAIRIDREEGTKIVLEFHK